MSAFGKSGCTSSYGSNAGADLQPLRALPGVAVWESRCQLPGVPARATTLDSKQGSEDSMLFLFGALCIPRPEFKAGTGRDIQEALASAGLSLKAAALYMDMDHAQLSRQLDGDGHVSVTRLASLPPEFHRWFAVKLAERYGLPKAIRAGQRLRMARASLRLEPHKERRHA